MVAVRDPRSQPAYYVKEALDADTARRSTNERSTYAPLSFLLSHIIPVPCLGKNRPQTPALVRTEMPTYGMLREKRTTRSWRRTRCDNN